MNIVKEPCAQHCEVTSDIDDNMLPDDTVCTSYVNNSGAYTENANEPLDLCVSKEQPDITSNWHNSGAQSAIANKPLDLCVSNEKLDFDCTSNVKEPDITVPDITLINLVHNLVRPVVVAKLLNQMIQVNIKLQYLGQRNINLLFFCSG